MIDFIKKYKKIGIILIIAILIVIIVYYAYYKYRYRNFLDDEYVTDDLLTEAIEYREEWSGKVKNISSLGDYYIIKNCVTKFYNNYYCMYTEDNSDNYFSEIIIDMLSEQYVNDNGITVDNVKDHFNELNENETYILNAYNVTNFDNMDVYIVDILVREISSNNIFENTVIIVCNTSTSKFCIYPDEYAKSVDVSSLSVGDEFNIEFDLNISSNSNNTYGAGSKGFDDYAKDVFNTYRKLLLYAPNYAYSLLTEDFKSSNYPTYEDFVSFIDENRTDIFLMTYSAYDVTLLDDDYSMYTAYDKNAKFYLVFYTNSLTNITYELEIL